MKKVLITPSISSFPQRLHNFLTDAKIYDSSCSPEARVFFIDRDDGYFLKRSALGALSREAMMDSYFHSIGLSCEVVDYFSESEDWLLTKRVCGEDLTHYTDRPTWLCDKLAELLSELHSRSFDGCPIMNRTADYLNTARKNYAMGCYDDSLFGDDPPFSSPADAMKYIESKGDILKADTLLHGDYCLPNIIMNGDDFSGFIDLGAAGVGDRHIDIFWGAFTLNFNLKTDKYKQRFFDAYGRDLIDDERLRLICAAEMFG